MQYQWEKLSPKEFELIVESLLRSLGFTNVSTFAGPGDEGEDIRAQETLGQSTITPVVRTWVIQCKRTTSLKRQDITEELAWCEAKDFDVWLLCTTCRPTPSFRRWFEALKAKRQYRFKIEAWWRSELDVHVATASGYLAHHLPRSILSRLGIPVGETTNHSTKAAISIARSIVDSQIRRFARGKYVPHLYVKRELQTQLFDFHAHEHAIAQAFKRSLVTRVSQAAASLASTTKAARSLAMPYSMGEALRGFKEEERKALIERVTVAWARYRNELWTSSAKWIKDAEQQSEQLRRLAEQFPSDRFIDHAPRLAALKQKIDTVLDLLQKAPTRTVPNIVQLALEAVRDGTWPRKSKSKLQRQSFSILSLPTTSCECENHIRTVQRELESLSQTVFLVIDRAGSGKTNVLCHVASELSHRSIVVLLFGKQIERESNELLTQLSRVLAQAFACDPSDAILTASKRLAAIGQFIQVLVDGINEARDVQVADTAVMRLLEALHGLRFRVTITCRDIYWAFFNYAHWSHFVHTTRRDALDVFSATEYAYALPLYLKHFKITCKLRGDAYEQLQHPLLLRFFCEAYGDVEGDGHSLGLVDNIRLKELFDEYLSRKSEQIRVRLFHQNPAHVTAYLIRLVEFMFANATTSILTNQVGDATGDRDVHTRDSMFVALLDEDIILDERPTNTSEQRYVSFVYEAFMEYMMARAIMTDPNRYAADSEEALFSVLNKAAREWINVKGVADFLALMLFDGEGERHAWCPIRFMRCLAAGTKIWKEAFWSSVGKLSGKHLNARLFDLFPIGMGRNAKVTMLKEMLKVLSRASAEEAHRLCGVLIWSSVLPLNALSWATFEQVPRMSPSEIRVLAESIANTVPQPAPTLTQTGITSGSIFNAVLPFLNASAQERVRKRMSHLGQPAINIELTTPVIQLVWDTFPRLQPMIINALITDNVKLRRFAAYRIAGSSWQGNWRALVCQIARNMNDLQVGSVILQR